MITTLVHELKPFRRRVVNYVHMQVPVNCLLIIDPYDLAL